MSEYDENASANDEEMAPEGTVEETTAPDETASFQNVVKVSVVGGDSHFINWTADLTVNAALREAHVAWTDKTQFFVNGLMVEGTATLTPGDTVVAVGSGIKGG